MTSRTQRTPGGSRLERRSPAPQTGGSHAETPLMVRGAGSLGLQWQRGRALGEPSCTAGGHCLAVFSRGAVRGESSAFLQGHRSRHAGPTLLVSSNFNHLPKAPSD